MMLQHEMVYLLPSHRRREIVETLAEAQDQGFDTFVSVRHISRRYGLSEEEVRHIEREERGAGWAAR